MRAQAEVLKRQKERDQGNFGGRHTDPLLDPTTKLDRTAGPEVGVSSPSAASANDSESARTLFERFVRENPNQVSADTLAQSRKAFDLFSDALPRTDFPASQISKKENRDWKTLLERCPIRAGDTNVFRGLGLRKIVERNAAVGQKTLSRKTINKHLTFIGGYCDWLTVNGWLDRNPVHGMLLSIDKEEQQGQSFTAAMLKQLFASPLYIGCASERGWHKPDEIHFTDYRYWVPVIAMFTGMRLGEIAQLDVDCVRIEDDVLLFDVNRDDGKKVKTANSIRVVPVHNTLIDLQFPSFVDKTRKVGGRRLFPELVPNARSQIAGDFSRDFNRFLRKIHITDVSFHSFRHGVADALRRAGYLDNQIALILGHSRERTTSSRYGAIAPGPVKMRKEMIDSIMYDGVELPKPLP